MGLWAVAVAEWWLWRHGNGRRLRRRVVRIAEYAGVMTVVNNYKNTVIGRNIFLYLHNIECD